MPFLAYGQAGHEGRVSSPWGSEGSRVSGTGCPLAHSDGLASGLLSCSLPASSRGQVSTWATSAPQSEWRVQVLPRASLPRPEALWGPPGVTLLAGL